MQIARMRTLLRLRLRTMIMNATGSATIEETAIGIGSVTARQIEREIEREGGNTTGTET